MARFRNCSRCSKCHRTLLSFDVLGVLDKATSFDVEITGRIATGHMLIWSDVDQALAQANRELRCGKAVRTWPQLIDQSIARSRRVKSITEPLRKLSWRVWNAAYRELTSGMVGA